MRGRVNISQNGWRFDGVRGIKYWALLFRLLGFELHGLFLRYPIAIVIEWVKA